MNFVKNYRIIGILVLIVWFSGASFSPAEKYKIKTVFIDPGHGGSDPGCHGVYSKEANVALKISLLCGSLITKNYPDIKVVYARTTDEFVDLYQRAVMANRCNADLFICIHCNASVNKSAYGTETFTMGLHRTDDNFAVAKRENSVILLENNYQEKYEGFDPNDPASYIMFSMLQNANLDQSVSIASKVQEEFEKIGRFNRGVQQAGFAVLVHTSMPSILVETGFLTNPTEERYMTSDEGEYELANSIFKAFETYKVESEKVDIKNKKNGNNSNIQITENKPKENQEQPVQQLLNESVNFYRIQFFTSKEPLAIDDVRLANVNGFIIEQGKDALYKYLSAKVINSNDALIKQTEFRKSGFSEAFIVPYINGRRQATNNLQDK
jgi:N-acetylmuramoyl-L-alanine amidase